MDDWEVKYNGNRFAWLGNGYSQTELDPRRTGPSTFGKRMMMSC